MAAGSAETAAAARLFVAVRPPPATLDLIATLPRPAQPGVRWTRRDQWHVTLLFLAQADVDQVRRRLGSLDAAPVSATLGAAPTALGRSAIVLPVEGLSSLAGAVHQAVGVEPDRPFTGHLTIARADRRSSRPTLTAPPGFAGSPARTFEVTEIELVRSERGSDGARHTVELAVALVGPPG